MTALAKVLAETERYNHPLFAFSARESGGGLELVIRPKDPDLGVHTYYAPIHPRDVESPQFPWSFQRYLYDCLHDYVVEMFLHTPQEREPGA